MNNSFLGNIKSVVLLSALLVFALACGGGGGGGSDVAGIGDSSGGIRAKLNAAKLLNAEIDDVVYIYNLDNPGVVDQEIVLSESNIESGFVVTYEFDADYQIIVKRKGVSFLQTIIREDQITVASETGELDLGKINSITTFLTHMVNLSIDEGMSSDAAIDLYLNKYFVDKEDFTDLDFNNFFVDDGNGGTTQMSDQLTTEFYDEAANRINAMSAYADILESIDSSTINSSNAEFMQNLFNSILTSTVNNWATVSEIADTEFNFEQTGFKEGLDGILFNSGDSTVYVVDDEDLEAIFFDPATAGDLTLFDLVVTTPDSTITGIIEGNPNSISGVDVYAIQTDSNGDDVVAFQTTTDDEGNFEFTGLQDTTYEVKFSKAGFEYRGKAISSTNIVIEGFDVGDELPDYVDNVTLEYSNDVLSLRSTVNKDITMSGNFTVVGQANVSGVLMPTAAGTAGQFMRIGADGNVYFDDFSSITSDIDNTANPWAIDEGGTGASTAAGARTNLGLGDLAVMNAAAVALTGGNISGITTISGTTVNATTVNSTDITTSTINSMSFPGVAGSNNQVLTADANGNIVFQSITDDMVANDLTVDGGNIDDSAIGATTPSTGAFTTLSSNVSLTAAALTAANLTVGGFGFPVSAGSEGQVLQLLSGNLSFSTISTSLSNSTMDNTVIGSTDPASGNFTAVEVTNLIIGDYELPGSAGSAGQVLQLSSGNLVFSTISTSLDNATMDNTIIGSTSRSSGNFTDVEVHSIVAGNLTSVTSANLATADIDGGLIDGADIGLNVEGAGNFTTLGANVSANLLTLVTTSVNINGMLLPLADGTSNQAIISQGNGFLTFGSLASAIEGATVSSLTVTDLTSSNVSISGGNLDGVAIGATTEATSIRSISINISDNATLGSGNTDTLRINSSVVGSAVTGNVEISGNLISSDNSFTLGVANHPWSAIYAIDLVTTSDARLKEEVKPLSYGLGEVMKLRPVSYEWIGRENKQRTIGLLAQEVEEVIEEAVSTADDSIGSRGVRYVNMVPVLIKAIQDQQEIIELQKKQLEAQNARINKIEHSIGE